MSADAQGSRKSANCALWQLREPVPSENEGAASDGKRRQRICRSAHRHVDQPRQLHLWKNVLPNTVEQPERYRPLSRLFMDLVAGFGIRFGTSATKVGDRRWR